MKRALLLVTLMTACGDDPPKKYPTFQECFDDKVDRQMRIPLESIVECCLDHDIGGGKPPHCGADDAECINYLTTNLNQTDADITLQTQACSVYVTMKAGS